MLDNLFQPMHLLLILSSPCWCWLQEAALTLKGLGEGIRSFKESMNAKDEAAPTPTEGEKKV